MGKSLFYIGAFVIFWLKALLVFSQTEMPVLGHWKPDSLSLAGCWHFVDSIGGEYALVGTIKGMSIVDLSDPQHPKERFRVPGILNNWRELKTWGGFAYVGSEASNSGITIVDLRSLPNTIYWKVWTGDSSYVQQITRSHTVQAENGFLYVFGGGPLTNGAIICDLKDPWNPLVVGQYKLNYVHDGYIRGDTMWTSEIYAGQFGVVDISDRKNPKLIATHPTPFAFNHNTGLSDDGKILYTTDEKPGAPLAAFDVHDLQNIRLLDTYHPSYKPDKEVHNVRVFGNFLVNPSYGGQLTIVDATRPDNLVETERALVGNSLVWDADPYLPSGILFAGAKNEGLFVFKPQYKRAAYLEGLVTDAHTGLSIDKAKIEIFSLNLSDSTDAYGQYKAGTGTPGTYSVQVSHPDYETQLFDNVELTAGQLTVLNVALKSTVSSKAAGQTSAESRIFPTVFDRQLVIENATILRCIVSLRDALGKIMWKSTVFPGIQVLDIPAGLSTGMYHAVLQDENGVVVGRWKILHYVQP